jgi:hypothetical protein
MLIKTHEGPQITSEPRADPMMKHSMSGVTRLRQSNGILGHTPSSTRTYRHKKAGFSNHPVAHKLIGHMMTTFASALAWEPLAEYINHKNGLTPSKLLHVNTSALNIYLLSVRVTKRATIIDVIHGGIPTHAAQTSLIFPRCHSKVETAEHIHQCMDEGAVTSRANHLQKFLYSLSSAHMPTKIIMAMNVKISEVLFLPLPQHISPTGSFPRNSVL